MAPKTILFLITHAPHGSTLCAEGLRTAMGLVSSTDEHTIVVVFVGDGAYATLAGVERGEAARYVATLAEFGHALKVEAESLTRAGIRPDEVASDVEIISRSALVSAIDGADIVIDF